jgi:type VI secretion system protein
MARDWTLLDRLSTRRREKTGTRPVSDEAASILHHLQRLLNARRGTAAAQMDYGIPDPYEVLHGHGDAIGQMAKAIKASIEKFEPRLTDVQVRHVANADDILTLRFQIVGQMVKSKDQPPVVFDTHVGHSGRIKVM